MHESSNMFMDERLLMKMSDYGPQRGADTELIKTPCHALLRTKRVLLLEV